MIKADYLYEADWDNDGLFGHAYSDISAYVLTSSWRLGCPNGPPEHAMAGIFNAALDNSSSIFSPFNASSPLFGLILPGVRIRVRMRIGRGAWQPRWAGRLQSLDPVVGEPISISTARLAAYGLLSRLAQEEIDVALQQNIKTGAAVNAILDAGSVPAGERVVEDGRSTVSKWWVAPGSNMLDALHELEDEELGRLREDEEGRVVFEDRAHSFSPATRAGALQATYGAGTLHIWNLRQENPIQGIFNRIGAGVKTFNVSGEIMLATIADVANGQGGTPPVVPAAAGSPPVPGGLELLIDFPTPSSPSNHAGVDEWGILDLEANTAADGSGTDITSDIDAVAAPLGSRLKVVFSNSNASPAHLVKLRAHGTAIVLGDGVPIKAEDAASIAKYGGRSYPYPSRWITDAVDGQAKLDYLLARHKDPVPRLAFDVRANYDSAHLAEVQERRVGDRIRVIAGSDFGLFVDGEFIVDSIAHAVDSSRMHVMTVECTKAPETELAASGTARDPYIIEDQDPGGIPHPPDLIEVSALSSGLKIVTAAVAGKYNVGIDEAEFRARLIAPGDPIPESVDLRTEAEGGSFSHNGADRFAIEGLEADSLGAQRIFTLGSAGRLFYAWRLHNGDGWSNWSDGNATPSRVIAYVNTGISTTEDSGPPSGWGVTLSWGPVANTVVVKATRPSTNGRLLRGWAIQIKNGAAGVWRALDAAAGAAATLYDGSAAGHTLSSGGKRLALDSGAGFGTAAAGDLALLDVRGGAFDLAHCQHRRIRAFEGDDPLAATWLEVDTAFEPQSLLDLRLKIVKPPWRWDSSEGYLGAEANNGWVDSASPGAAGISGDSTTKEFVSPPIEIPSGLANPEARVFFTNNYSTGDNGLTHSTGIAETSGIEPPTSYNDFRDSDLWIALNSDPSVVSMSIAPEGITLTGLKARGFPLSNDLFAGVISKSLFYPDPGSGLLSFSASFDSYVDPSDQTASGDCFLMGILLIAQYPGLYQPGPMGLFTVWGRCQGGTPVVRDAIMAGFMQRNYPQAIYYDTANVSPSSGASFTITQNWGPRTLIAGTTRSWGMLSTVFAGTGGMPNVTVSNFNYDSNTPYGMLPAMLGFRVALGLWPAHNSSVGSVRLTGFSLIAGRTHRQDFGAQVAPAAQGGSASGIRIFSVSSG